MPETQDERVRFAEFELNLRSGELWDAVGRRVFLSNQPFRILAALIRARGDIVTREQLRRELWPEDTFVDYEHGLNAAIKRLREAIRDSASAPRFIETIPRVGYRFLCPIGSIERSARRESARADDAFEARSGTAPVAGRAGVAHTGADGHRAVGAVAGIAVLLILISWAVAAGWLARSRQDPPNAAERSLVRLTSSAGLNIDPALSPDGSLLAYASDRQGTSGFDIWIQPVAGGTTRRLTSDEGDEVEPSFAPDGASIFYSRRETGGIYRVDVLGGEPRSIVAVTRARTPRVSPDGRWLVYWTGQPVWATGAITPPGATSALAIVPVDGGTPRELASNLSSARHGIWSPDGRRILFLGERQDGRLEWFVVSPSDGEPSSTGAIDVLHKAGVSGTPIPGDWSPRGVVFSVSGADNSNIRRLPIAADSGTVSGPLSRLTFGSAEERSPASSRPDVVAFSSIVENVDVWRLPLDAGSGVAAGSIERVTDNAAIDQMMDGTRDGTLMVFISSRTKRTEAWIRDLRTGRERQLSFNGAELARIHPDGSHVAVTRPGHPRIAEIVPTTGGATTTLCTECTVDDWSPDGSKVLIGRGRPEALFVYDVATSRETPLASHPVWNLYRGRFSPDGRWVTFHTTNSATHRQIYVVPTGGSEAVPPTAWIPVVTDFGIQPAWSSDSRGVYHFSLRDGSFCAWLQPIDPATATPVGEPRAVHHLHHPRLRAVAAAMVNNDVFDNHLYVTLTETTGNIWLLDQ